MTETPETLLANQWLCNPILASHAFWRGRTAQLLGEHDAQCVQSAGADVVCALAEKLEENVVGDAHEILQGFGLYRDLVDLALERVDSSVVAEALLKQASPPEGWKAVETPLVTTERTKSLSRRYLPRAPHRRTTTWRRERPTR